MHAVRSGRHARRVAVLERAALHDGEQPFELGQQDVGAPSRSCSASPVSSTSEDVRPKWIQRPAGPIEAGDDVDERGDVVAA